MTDTPDNASVNGVATDTEGTSVDEEEQRKFQKVLAGSLHDLPSLSSKIVRIFTSSTFTGKKSQLSFTTCEDLSSYVDGDSLTSPEFLSSYVTSDILTSLTVLLFFITCDSLTLPIVLCSYVTSDNLTWPKVLCSYLYHQ